MKNGEFVKPERMTGSPATKLLLAVKVTADPALDQPVIEAALMVEG